MTARAGEGELVLGLAHVCKIADGKKGVKRNFCQFRRRRGSHGRPGPARRGRSGQIRGDHIFPEPVLAAPESDEGVQKGAGGTQRSAAEPARLRPVLGR